jgi:uncharacterized protein with GYD domain
MPTYISLVNWTDKGIGTFKDSLDRHEASLQLASRFGGMFETYYTIGPYDIVAIAEFPDDESATAFALMLGSQGNVRTTTLRAFSAEEMRSIIAKTG